MKNMIYRIHQSKTMGRIFHTLDYCLQKELQDCETVLDLGCGPSSPLQYCKGIKKSVGVEIFEPYLAQSRKRKIHNKYIKKEISEVDFPDNSFDVVMMIEVLEHLPAKNGLAVIKKAEKWAKKKVIISSPNGFVSQKEVDSNPWQKHLSGWSNSKMKKMGYRTKGLAGLKTLRQEVSADTMGNDLTTSIRLKPRLFWFIIASMSQIVTYYIPSLAFEIFSVKTKPR